jgi:hypothetical protein
VPLIREVTMVRRLKALEGEIKEESHLEVIGKLS